MYMQKQNDSLSEIVRRLIDVVLKFQKQDNNAYILLEMARAAGKSGIKNLSESYKKILYKQGNSKK